MIGKVDHIGIAVADLAAAVATYEGVLGLRRAAAIAGAESQLMTLWKVDDSATRHLMEAYYRRLVAGEGRAEALRQVQLEMLKTPEARHPFYWASFIPIGAWGPIELVSGRDAADPAHGSPDGMADLPVAAR